MIDGKKVLFSGMQATGTLTLGNYLGALKNHNCQAGAGGTTQKGEEFIGFIYCGRVRPEEKLYLLPVACIRACGTGLDIELLYVYRGTEPYDPV